MSLYGLQNKTEERKVAVNDMNLQEGIRVTKKTSKSLLLCGLEAIGRLSHSLKSCKVYLLLIFMLDSFKARVHYPECLLLSNLFSSNGL